MEIKNKQAMRNVSLRAVIFDFDGTISTLRQGWEKVMRPLMLEMINPCGGDAELEQEVSRFIDESTGIQTVYQMQWLAERVRTYGSNPQTHDEWWYKDEYNRRLMKSVSERLHHLHSGKLNAEDYMIKGSHDFVARLHENGIELYVASGTDECDVIREVDALGLTCYFTAIAGAPCHKAECSKKAVIRNLIEKKRLRGDSLLVVGDGKVEIQLGKEAGALTLGAATDEIRLFGVNEVKRQRLLKAGADVIIGDFSESDALADWLNLQ